MPALAGSDHSTGEGSSADNDRLLPGVYPAAPVLTDPADLREPYHPFFDIDWSTALRGTYTEGTSGERFDVRLVPNVSLEHLGTRSAVNIEGSAEIVRPTEGQIDVSALRLNGAGSYALDSATALSAAANLSLTQDIAGSPGLASNIEDAPQRWSGGGQFGVTRQFGKFNVGLTGAVQRDSYDDTTLDDGTTIDNADQDLWALDANLRLGFQATPIFEVFGQAGVGRDLFDTVSSSLLIKTDATDATLEAGVIGRWNEVLEASASTGLNFRRFDAQALGESTTSLYDASLTYRPTRTLALTAGFSTIVAPPGPDASGTTRIEYAAYAEAAYTVNSWLALRAMADWSRARFTGTADTEEGYGLGAGADYTLNAHTAINADYDYDYSDSTTRGEQDAHRVSMGITLSR